MRSTLRSAFSSATLAGAALVCAQVLHAGHASLQAAPPQPALSIGPRTWVVTDQPGDGNMWARGATYKARFGADATELIPAFGKRAPQNQALLFAAPELYVGGARIELDARAQPVLGAPVPASGPIEHQRVSYERGALSERWDLSARELEHSFVLEQSLGAGEILLRLPLRGELAYAGRDAAPGAGLHFAARLDSGLELGGLDYSDARTIDSDGRVLEHAATWVVDAHGRGALELRVDAAFAAQARYPLVIDPIVTVFGVDQSGQSSARQPDISYDATNHVWLVVWSEEVSAFDTDVFARRYGITGSLLEEVGVAIDGAPAIEPSVANNRAANQFLVTWLEQGLAFDQLRARTRSAGSTSQGAVITLANEGSLATPVVGGSSDPTSTNYLVAYLSNTLIAFNTALIARTVSTAGVVGAETLLDGAFVSGGAYDLAITKSAGLHQRWALAWIHHDCSPLLCEGEMRAAAFDSNGNQVGAVAEAGLPNGALGAPAISGDGADFVMVYPLAAESLGQTSDIGGALLRVSGSTFAVVDTVASLTALETPIFASKDQTGVALTSAGRRYTYAYREKVSSSGTHYNHHVATFFAPSTLGSLEYIEQHVLVQNSELDDSDVALASTFDGGDGPELVGGVWTRSGAVESDVDGFLYDPLGPGGVSSTATGCGLITSEPKLGTPAFAALGAPFAVTLGGTGSPLILLGLPAAAPIPLCSGGCALGVFPILAQFGVASLAFQLPPDTALLGVQVALQGVRLNSSGAGGSCGAPQYPITFRTSDTKVLTFQ
jgi:hypothetical protein